MVEVDPLVMVSVGEGVAAAGSEGLDGGGIAVSDGNVVEVDPLVMVSVGEAAAGEGLDGGGLGNGEKERTDCCLLAISFLVAAARTRFF